MNRSVLFSLVILFCVAGKPAHAGETLSLAGQWRFALDRNDAGTKENWFTKALPEKIQLPGILEAQGYGDEISTSTPWVLSLYDHFWYLRADYAAYTNAGVCLRAAKRDTQAALSFQRALMVRPNYAEAAYQLSELDLQRGEIQEARTELDHYLASYDATADLLLIGVQIAQKQGDRMAQERYARKLRLDFPGSEQARALDGLMHPPG